MSRLFGPLSETMSRVSWRDCALAGDHTAGAEKALAAVSAAIVLRNSRRFMELSQGCAALGSASRVPSPAAPLPQVKVFEFRALVQTVRHLLTALWGSSAEATHLLGGWPYPAGALAAP